MESDSGSSTFGCVRVKVRSGPEVIPSKVDVEWGGWKYTIPIWVEVLPSVSPRAPARTISVEPVRNHGRKERDLRNFQDRCNGTLPISFHNQVTEQKYWVRKEVQRTKSNQV